MRFVQADAQLFPFEPASVDAAFSRFGVIFFTDPTAAFVNIRRSLKSNGRLAFVCWRALEDNLLDILPLRGCVLTTTRMRPARSHSLMQTACAAFLGVAGFEDIKITACDDQVGSGDLDTMLAVRSRVGALGKTLRENPELRGAAVPAVRSALAAHAGPDGVSLNAATWVVTARPSGRAPV